MNRLSLSPSAHRIFFLGSQSFLLGLWLCSALGGAEEEEEEEEEMVEGLGGP